MPSAGQILRARKRFALLLPDRATILRAAEVANTSGGQTTTWPVLASDVPCRLSPVEGGEVSSRARGGDRIADEASAIVTFAAGTDVDESDRVTIAGVTFDVQLVRLRGEWEIARRCEVREI